MSLLGSSLLPGFSGVVAYRLIFFVLCLKSTYEWIHIISVLQNANSHSFHLLSSSKICNINIKTKPIMMPTSIPPFIDYLRSHSLSFRLFTYTIFFGSFESMKYFTGFKSWAVGANQCSFLSPHHLKDIKMISYRSCSILPKPLPSALFSVQLFILYVSV